MKKILGFIVTSAFAATMAVTANAQIGDMGYFGGISDGTALPKTIDETLKPEGTNTQRKMNYKEIIWLSGKPVEFVGEIEVSTSGKIDEETGTYKETYNVSPNAYSNADISIRRRFVLDVNYEKVPSIDTPGGYQIVKNSSVNSWTETIVVDGITYTLDKDRSYFSKTSNEDKAGGVNYIKGNISSRSVYTTGTEGEMVVQTNVGETYGYDQAWSSTETQRINTTIDFRGAEKSWQLQAQLRPSVTVNKVLQYSPNEPTVTSFNGNYYEILQRENGLQYDILMQPQEFSRDVPKNGSISIETFSDIEALRVPISLDLTALNGNGAEEDIKQLYSMKVLDQPQYFKPTQGITRSQFMTAMVKALKLPLDTDTTTENTRNNNRNKRAQTIEYLFQDFSSQEDDYDYIKAAYNSGITVGRENGTFKPDELIPREEAFCVMTRALGMQNTAYSTLPYTSFVDNDEISDWAVNEVYYAAKLGLISPDEEGKIHPRDSMSKGEAAALINSFVKYMRQKMQIDYIENIVYETK